MRKVPAKTLFKLLTDGVASGKVMPWLPLLVLLGALLVGALTFDPRGWPQPAGDEATYMMAAQSLAWDLDLDYSAGDLERFRRLRGTDPNGLILQSNDDGRSLTYGKPLFYPLAIAPWVRLFPRQGPAIFNALMLFLAAVLVARALSEWLGKVAPLWVSVLVFGSVVFAYTFWAHADLFLMCCVAIALSLISGDREVPSRRAWAVAGVLLGIVVLTRPFYLPLLLPFGVALLGRRRFARPALLSLGVCLVIALAASLLLQGSWSPYAAERQGYYEYTGFPGELGDASWNQRVAARGTNTWLGSNPLPFGFDLRLLLWNVVYLFVGRHVGLLVYCLPLVLGLVAFRSDRYRWSLLFALAAIAAFFLVARPFNFWGGGGAMANRYLLPVLPVFWFLVGRARGWIWPLAVALLAAPALWPLWTAPRGFLHAEDGSFRHVSRVVEHRLPYETTQNQIKPSGRDDFHHRAGGPQSPALWVKPLSSRIASSANGEWMVVRAGDRNGSVLLGSDRPLEAFVVEEQAPEAVVPRGSAVPEVDSDRVARRLQVPAHLRAAHRMWWTKDLVYLYELDLDRWVSESEVGNYDRVLRLHPVRVGDEQKR